MKEHLKIAVKLPDGLNEVMSCFPLLHAINEFLNPDDFHIIATKESFELLTLLPFKAYFHEFDVENYKNLLDVHRFAVDRRDLSHANIFFSLTEEPKDQFMAMTFRGKQRVGFEGKWSALFLNKKKLYPGGFHKAEAIFSLIKFFNETDLANYKKVTSKKYEEPFKDWSENPYLMINLPYDSINNEIPPDWTEFFDFFDETKIFISCYDATDENRPIVLERFLDTLKKRKTIHPFYFKTLSEFANLCAYSAGCISQNSIISEVSCYVGTPTIAMYEKGDPQNKAPLYFLGQCNIHSFKDGSLLKKPGAVKSLDIVTKFDLGMLYEKVRTLFDYEIKEEDKDE